MIRLFRRAGAVVLVALAAGCTQSPTSPSVVSPGAMAGQVAQETPSVPAAIIPTNPSQSLGATRFLAFGDSITFGIESSFDGAFLYDTAVSYPRMLQSMLGTYNPAQAFSMINEGRPGEWARDGEARLRTVLDARTGASVPPNQRPQVLLLLEGINDMNNGVSAVRAASSLAQLAQIGRLYNLTVLVATMPQTWVSTAPNGEIRQNAADKVPAFNAEVARLIAGVQNVYLVDVNRAFGTNRALMGGDGLHPTPAGYTVMAQKFHEAIIERLPVRGSLQ